jgi:hypothetical protein
MSKVTTCPVKSSIVSASFVVVFVTEEGDVGQFVDQRSIEAVKVLQKRSRE